MANAQLYHAVGKRKSAIARIYLKNGTGKILVNEKPLESYFAALYQNSVVKPFRELGAENKYDVMVRVRGGGASAQAEACMYGIAKALTLVSSDNRPPLKKAMLLTRDSRVVERKKYGHKKARKSFQFSKR